MRSDENVFLCQFIVVDFAAFFAVMEFFDDDEACLFEFF